MCVRYSVALNSFAIGEFIDMDTTQLNDDKPNPAMTLDGSQVCCLSASDYLISMKGGEL